MRSRIIECRGCPTVECTCFTELEDELLEKLNVAVRRGIEKCIEALRSKEGKKVFYDGGNEWGLHVSDWLEQKFLNSVNAVPTTNEEK